MEQSQEQAQDTMTQVYIPVVNIEQVIARHALGKLFIALAKDPKRICGVAYRIGYTGHLATDLVIYRLKVKLEDNSRTITLPHLYVVEGGTFVEYEEWRRSRSNLI